jgi:cytochrome P450
MMKTGERFSLTDDDVLRHPLEAYQFLRDQAPVYVDPKTGFYVISRYQDIRALLLDQKLTSEHFIARLRGNFDRARAERIGSIFAEKGWRPTDSLAGVEGDYHREVRELFQQYLRAGKVREYEDLIRNIAYSEVDKFATAGHCELVSQFSERVSMRVICAVLGVSEDILPLIKVFTTAMARNIDLVLPEDEEIKGVEKQIEAQHFIMNIVRGLREKPDDTFLSAFVNAKFPSSRALTDEQILEHVMFDLFMAGAETAAKAFTTGVAILTQKPEIYHALEADQEATLKEFVEEILRVDGPSSSLYRIALKDITLHNVTIPEGSLIMLRIGAANLDPRHFVCPADLDLSRQNSTTHVAFGSGRHSCVGAPLARRELYWGFKALLDRLTDIQLARGERAEYAPSVNFRGIQKLNITFSQRAERGIQL